MDLRRGRGKERVFGDRKVNSIGGSSSRTDNKEVMVDNYGNNVRERVNGLRFEQRGAAIETEFVEKYSRISQFPIDNWMSGDEIETNMSSSMSVNSSVGDVSAHLQNFAGSVRAKGSMDQFRGVERDRFDGFYASSRVGVQRGRIPTSAYLDERPSNYKVDSFDGMSEVANLEQDRAELLRKLDELKQKLSGSYDVVDKPWEPVPRERSRTPPDPYGDRLTYNLSMQPYAVDEQMTRPPYLNYSHGHVPFMGYHNMDTPNFYPPQRHPLNAIPEYEGPSQQQMKWRPPPHLHQYPRPQSHEYFMGQRMEFSSNPHDNTSHSPACSCLGCYNQNPVASPQVSLDDFGNQRVPKAPVSLNTYQQVKPHDYNPRHASPPPLHTRWQSDFDSEPRSTMAINRRGRIFHPVAGGAPFITCFWCFEILKLPRKLENTNKNRSKLQCGSCSTVISLEIKNKKLFTSKDSKQQSSEVGQSSNEALKGSVLSLHGSPNAGDTKSPCDDLDHSDQTLPFIDTEDNLPTEDQKLDMDESEKRRGPTSTSSIPSKEEEEEEISDCVIARLDMDESVKRQGLTLTSSVPSKEGEEISDCVIANTDVSGSAELPTKESFSPKRPGSPLWEQPGSSKHRVSRAEKGNDSDCKNQDKALFRKIASRQNSVKDSSVETNVDVSYNEYLNTNISKDSAEGRKEQDPPKIGKGADSLLVGLIKKSSKDVSKSNQGVEKTRPTVFINGQPIPDHVVRKAEMLAGPIRPGDYWYDFRAGFWGVMGQACLGIIPPFIEEFNYPIPTNCAAGNTGVYVNGRELHQRDLDLLAGRGLPTTREKFYIVETSGRVVDEDSGEDLKSLGKLAPTIEKAKRGFGMKVPRMVV
ncbi:hypothetical protein D8674_042641 [Pyrus ussuriensis x Pyrus communis]|uniref:Probable zinc-ribbon domain-containing protein n=1 Tax=Pyrus ussuriensis x Pyrus communis TaxID=2448454 RepID=A0A5N5G9R1_9ROSA|nr:hypothetical protein D8674_042641 [Pyrus ussuriensis x Pyrus communis]